MSSIAQPERTNISFDAASVNWSASLLERDILPDWLIRIGIRRLLRQRLREEDCGGVEEQQEYLTALVHQLKISPVAIATDSANEQHYEVPAQFFQYVLGRNLKYSSALWKPGCSHLDDAEDAMLAQTAAHAQLENGQEVLELGCGWGSLTLYVASRFPQSRILGVSNSHSQREYIGKQAAERGLSNIQIVTADMNDFETPRKFDRIVSVEMFEHMRNYKLLLKRVSSWMNPQALLFVHIFTHKRFAYPFEIRDASDWMAKHFFTGGMMPSHDLLLHFQRDVTLQERWHYDGTHYQKTARAWLAKMDEHREQVLGLFADTYAGSESRETRQREALRWFVRWRVFFMCCEELWGYRGGQEWGVSHYRFTNAPSHLLDSGNIKAAVDRE